MQCFRFDLYVVGKCVKVFALKWYGKMAICQTLAKPILQCSKAKLPPDGANNLCLLFEILIHSSNAFVFFHISSNSLLLYSNDARTFVLEGVK